MSGLPYPPSLVGYGLGTPKIQVPGTARPAGLVVAASMDVTRLHPGDEVFGVCDVGQEGAYAEKIAIKAAIVAQKTDRLSHVDAAALALAGLTAICTGSPARHGAISAARAPSTTTTAETGAASAAAVTRRNSGCPSTASSCFGRPMRVDAPAARISNAQREGSAMDRFRAVAQVAGRAAGLPALHLGQDG